MKIFARMIVATLLNSFDCFTIIEGGTGIGKSTLAYRIVLNVRGEFRRLFDLDIETVRYYWENVMEWKSKPLEEFIAYILELKNESAYRFIPKRDLIYSQKEMMKYLSSWHRIGIPDEMVNVTFNRDFFSQDQKDIIKMINMYRDHKNLTIACVPFFATLDNQIKNLCKIRLTVLRRGFALLQTPNKTIYVKDRWDSATNEKIEREWLIKGKLLRPSYAKLTTARGFLKFSPLPKNIQDKYQKIKDDKRARIEKDEMGIDDFDAEEKKSIVEIAVDKLIKGAVKNSSVLEGMAVAEGIDRTTLYNRIRKRLRELDKPTSIAQYYWDKKAKNEEFTLA